MTMHSFIATAQTIVYGQSVPLDEAVQKNSETPCMPMQSLVMAHRESALKQTTSMCVSIMATDQSALASS